MMIDKKKVKENISRIARIFLSIFLGAAAMELLLLWGQEKLVEFSEHIRLVVIPNVDMELIDVGAVKFWSILFWVVFIIGLCLAVLLANKVFTIVCSLTMLLFLDVVLTSVNIVQNDLQSLTVIAWWLTCSYVVWLFFGLASLAYRKITGRCKDASIKITKEVDDMEQASVQSIMAYLEKYDDPYAENNGEKLASVILKLLEYLKVMPESHNKIKGSYSLNSYKDAKYELFYTADMVLFKRLLNKKKYNAFIHEMYDFLKWKIMKGDVPATPQYLPVNIKHALIEVIKNASEEM